MYITQDAAGKQELHVVQGRAAPLDALLLYILNYPEATILQATGQRLGSSQIERRIDKLPEDLKKAVYDLAVKIIEQEDMGERVNILEAHALIEQIRKRAYWIWAK